MKAALCIRYGTPESLRIAEVPTPTPRKGELLIRVRATTVSSGDARVRALALPRGMHLLGRAALGFSGPRNPILGTELCGEVAAAGPGVSRFREGDHVIAFTGFRMRAHAEFCVVPEAAAVIRRPAGLSDEEAASLCFGGTTALWYLRDRGAVRAGHHVLIIGASGAVGSAAVQLARHFGARVTAVCSSPNADLARALGAHEVIDYTQQDYTRGAAAYDLVFDAVNALSLAQGRALLAPGGRLLMVAADLPAMLQALVTSFSSRKACVGTAPERREDVEFLADLAASGVWRPAIDSVFPFDQIAAAHARVDTGRKRGSVVVRAAPAG